MNRKELHGRTRTCLGAPCRGARVGRSRSAPASCVAAAHPNRVRHRRRHPRARSNLHHVEPRPVPRAVHRAALVSRGAASRQDLAVEEQARHALLRHRAGCGHRPGRGLRGERARALHTACRRLRAGRCLGADRPHRGRIHIEARRHRRAPADDAAGRVAAQRRGGHRLVPVRGGRRGHGLVLGARGGGRVPLRVLRRPRGGNRVRLPAGQIRRKGPRPRA